MRYMAAISGASCPAAFRALRARVGARFSRQKNGNARRVQGRKYNGRGVGQVGVLLRLLQPHGAGQRFGRRVYGCREAIGD